MTREEIAVALQTWALPPNRFGDMEVLINWAPHFIAHDGGCVICGKGHSQLIPLAQPAGFYTNIPRALAQARAYLDLVERIEKEAERQREKYDRWKADVVASLAVHAAWHTAMVLSALLPQKEPT